MYNMQIRPENTCWVWCDCDSHLMKPPGLAASIWSRLPSYNTSLATGALRASLITDNEWKENPETEGERLLEGRKRGNGGWEREKEAPAVLTSAASLNSKTLTAVPTGIVLACVLNMRAARKLHTHQKWKKQTNKSSTDLQLEGLKLKVQLTLPKMCLVNGDQDDLSSKPKGMKIISELLDTEWKQRLEDFGSADMRNSVHVWQPQCSICAESLHAQWTN